MRARRRCCIVIGQNVVDLVLALSRPSDIISQRLILTVGAAVCRRETQQFR